MAVRDPFDGACRDAAKGLRRLPSEVRKALGRDVKTKVADPLAGAVRSAYAGQGRVGGALVQAVKTRVNVEPVISVGGAKQLVSGGASGRQLVYGHEFGSGTPPQRAERLARRNHHGTGRRGSRTRGTTAQFAGPGHNAIFGTFAKEANTTFDNWLNVIDPVLQDWENGVFD